MICCCDRCKRPCDIDLLDGKQDTPTPLALELERAGMIDAEQAEPVNFDLLHCPICYGPGYLPGGDKGWGDAIAWIADVAPGEVASFVKLHARAIMAASPMTAELMGGDW